MAQTFQSFVREGFGRMLLAACVALSVNFGFAQQNFSNDVSKLFRKYCFECHGEGASKGKVDIEEMLAPANLKKQEREWERAWKIVRHEFMPPVGADQPSTTERKAITD